MRRLLAWLVLVGVVVSARPASAQRCGEPLKVPAGTPKEEIAKLLAGQMFEGIKLSDLQQQKAVQIVTTWMMDRANLDRSATDYRQRIRALDVKRDGDLRALLTRDADRAKLDACFKKMERSSGSH